MEISNEKLHFIESMVHKIPLEVICRECKAIGPTKMGNVQQLLLAVSQDSNIQLSPSRLELHSSLASSTFHLRFVPILPVNVNDIFSMWIRFDCNYGSRIAAQTSSFSAYLETATLSP